MTALADFARKVAGMVRLHNKPREEPEALFKPRPMVGLLSRLTEEQRKAAFSYEGPENHGDPAFRLRDNKC